MEKVGGGGGLGSEGLESKASRRQSLGPLEHRATRGQGQMKDFCSLPSALCNLCVDSILAGRASFWLKGLGPEGETFNSTALLRCTRH